MYLSYFAFSFYNFLLFFFLFSYVSHIFFHPFSAHKDASRSRQALSNGALVAKFGFDTAENESSKVCKKAVRQLDTVRLIELDQT